MGHWLPEKQGCRRSLVQHLQKPTLSQKQALIHTHGVSRWFSLPLPELGNLSPVSETIQAATFLLFCSQTHPTQGFPHRLSLLLLSVHLPITERPNQLPEGTPMASETPPV